MHLFFLSARRMQCKINLDSLTLSWMNGNRLMRSECKRSLIILCFTSGFAPYPYLTISSSLQTVTWETCHPKQWTPINFWLPLPFHSFCLKNLHVPGSKVQFHWGGGPHCYTVSPSPGQNPSETYRYLQCCQIWPSTAHRWTCLSSSGTALNNPAERRKRN